MFMTRSLFRDSDTQPGSGSAPGPAESGPTCCFTLKCNTYSAQSTNRDDEDSVPTVTSKCLMLYRKDAGIF